MTKTKQAKQEKPKLAPKLSYPVEPDGWRKGDLRSSSTLYIDGKVFMRIGDPDNVAHIKLPTATLEESQALAERIAHLILNKP